MLPISKKWLFNSNNFSVFLKHTKRLGFFVCFLFLKHSLQAQVNQIIDPSFEYLDSCSSYTYFFGPHYWHALDSTNNTNQATSICIPVYYNRCIQGGYGSVPLSIGAGGSYQEPKSGNGMYAIEFFLLPSVNPNYNRDYLRGRIRGALINGNQYCGKFYVNLFNSQYYGVDRFGAYLDNGALDVNNECLPIVVTPTFENPAFNYITDTLGWQRVHNVV